jgi:hypothetical protein
VARARLARSRAGPGSGEADAERVRDEKRGKFSGAGLLYIKSRPSIETPCDDMMEVTT